jgi:hypothetical protein
MAGVFLLQITVKNHEEDDHADGNQGQTADQNGNRLFIKREFVRTALEYFSFL